MAARCRATRRRRRATVLTIAGIGSGMWSIATAVALVFGGLLPKVALVAEKRDALHE